MQKSTTPGMGQQKPPSQMKVQLFNHQIQPNKWGIYIYLVGGIPTPLKNMSSSVGMIIPSIWKNKKCSKPPTRYIHLCIYRDMWEYHGISSSTMGYNLSKPTWPLMP